MIWRQGDLIEVSFDPTVGHEPMKRRPALVASADDFNLRSSLTAVVPISTRVNGYPLHIPLEPHEDDGGVRGVACVEQVRTLDLERRRAQRLGAAHPESMTAVLETLRATFGV